MKEKKSNNTIIIISRLKSALKIRTDTAFADYLGVKQNTISTWKKKDKPDYELLISKFNNLDLNYILKGDSSPTEKDKKHHPYDILEFTQKLKEANLILKEISPDKNQISTPCLNCSFIQHQNLTERILRYAETALESVKGEVESKEETITLLLEKISNLETALSEQKRKDT